MRWPAWMHRLVPYLGRRAAERDVDAELRLHADLERERQRDGGVPEEEALRAARRRLGNATLIRERTRDVWGWPWLDDLGRDVRHAVRAVGRSPGFAATVVLVLALGIGATTTMFSVVYSMLIRPLPYPDAGAIVRISESVGRRPSSSIANPSLHAIVEEAESFEQVAAYGPSSTFQWARPEGADTVRGARVSPAMFPLLRARPHLGRLFTEEEARAGADRVVLLSHGVWTRRFVSDPDIVGAVLELDAALHTVVGVLAEGFFFPSPEVEVWTPFVDPGWSISGTGPDGGPGLSVRWTYITALGRLRPGVSIEQATTEVRTILQRSGVGARVRDARGGRAPAATLEVDGQVVPLQEEMVRGYRPALLALSAATALVLLIACVNVAGLLLARGVTRRRALAVCAALGAGRGRLVRQLLTECVVLSAAGGLLGAAVAAAALGGLPAVVPGDVARLDDVGINGPGLAFALALSVVVGLVFGAAPAFQWSRFGLVRALKEGNGAVRRRFPPVPLEPGAGGAGRCPGGPRGRAAHRRRAAPAQLRRARHRRPRLRPDQRHHRADRQPRDTPGRRWAPSGRRRRRGRRAFPGRAPRGRDAAGASAGRIGGRDIVRPAPRGLPSRDHIFGPDRRSPRAPRRRTADGRNRLGESGLLRRDEPASPRGAPLRGSGPGRKPGSRRRQRVARAAIVRRRGSRRTARAVRVRGCR